MKILHTSDWHLGHTLYGYDRTEEQQGMLEQMEEIVRKEKPDVFLLCGDVYHTAQPSASVQTMFAEALVKIHEAHPAMRIIITAGNHDSGSKHDIFQTPWRALNVYTLGNLYKENREEHLIEVPGKGFVIAIPYCYERNIPEGFFQEMIDMANERNTENLPIVMMAHTTVNGCDFAGHDNATEMTVGGIDSFNISELGEGYDYLALGHIHREQFIHTGKHNARYCGTPIQVSFDECYDHSVSLIEISQHGEMPVTTTLTINNPRPLVTLPTEGTATWEVAQKLLKDFPSDIPAYIRLNVVVDGFLPTEAHAEAIALTEGKKCRFCHINAKRSTVNTVAEQSLSVEEFQAESPINIVRRFFEDKNVCFDEELTEVFNEAVRLTQTETNN